MKYGLIGGALVIILCVVVVPLIARRFMRSDFEQRIGKSIPADSILLKDYKANSLGRESQGAAQIRGNGALVLTRDALHFFQFSPERDVRIPLASITGVKSVGSHLGKTIGQELLHVSFMEEGKPDAFAWYVTDLPAWSEKLAALTGRKTGDARSNNVVP